MDGKVMMTCMTTKQKFEAEEPDVTVLSNGRFAYRVKCPWEGKNGKELYAFKFCSTDAYKRFKEKQAPPEPDLDPTLVAEPEPEVD